MGVVLVGLLPGALYVWTFERVVGHWGLGFSDRLFRFVGISAAFHATAAPLTYAVWHNHLRPGATPASQALPLWLWAVAVAYVGIPSAIGTSMGLAHRSGRRWARLVNGSAAPTAWDAVFGADPAGWIIIRLKSGTWVGGAYAEGSYSGGFPEPADLFLSREFWVDQETGDFRVDDGGNPIPLADYGLLIRWEEMEYLEFRKEASAGAASV